MRADLAHARVYGLLARAADKVVLLRRGPTRHVLCLTWNLDTDEIVAGQWFKGRIYERRCDLNPQGTLLCYFAAVNKGPVPAWTAVSRPPWLSAAAFFSKFDSWGGGGLFADEFKLELNHLPGEPTPADRRIPKKSKKKRGRKVPRYMREVRRPAWQENSIRGDRCPEWLDVGTMDGPYAGRGEDDPIHAIRLERDGWEQVATPQPEFLEQDFDAPYSWICEPPLRHRKALNKDGFALEVSLHAINERNGPWYVETMQIIAPNGSKIDFGRTDWCDVDHKRNVLFSLNGIIYRLAADKINARCSIDDARQVADLSKMQFQAVVAPAGVLAKPDVKPQ